MKASIIREKINERANLYKVGDGEIGEEEFMRIMKKTNPRLLLNPKLDGIPEWILSAQSKIDRGYTPKMKKRHLKELAP